MPDPVVITRGVIYKDADKRYRWKTIGGNGEIVGWGEAYGRKEDAVQALMAHLNDEIDIEEEW
jgi:uncharacterized protein YegP (UPF0339 family)